MDENAYKYYLAAMPGCGSVLINKLLMEYGTAGAIYKASLRQDARFKRLIGDNKIADVIDFNKSFEPEREYEKMLSDNIGMYTVDDAEYPERLKCLERKPYALFVKGQLPADDIKAVAIIGARNYSPYGEYVASCFGERIAESGVNIISGMARGIDGIGQRGALLSGGKTYAVLGCGVDVCYPKSNRQLYEDIIRTGGVISIFPPGTQPLKRHFPIRNEIVAALSDIVIVIEARLQSGTSHTVELALKQGKDVYAVPGRLTDRLSDGCNMLIKQGAGVALSPDDILKELEIIKNRTGDIIKKEVSCAKGSGTLMDCIDVHPRSAEDIYKRWSRKHRGVTLEGTLRDLALLSIEGSIMQIGSGYYYRVI